jgi:hypothetical protein
MYCAADETYRAKLAQHQWPVQPEPDDRLRLTFTGCHPALPKPHRSHSRSASYVAHHRTDRGREHHPLDRRRAADHSRETQDHQRRHPVPDSMRRRAARTPRRGAGRDLPLSGITTRAIDPECGETMPGPYQLQAAIAACHAEAARSRRVLPAT